MHLGGTLSLMSDVVCQDFPQGPQQPVNALDIYVVPYQDGVGYGRAVCVP